MVKAVQWLGGCFCSVARWSLQLNAPAVLTNNFTEASLILTGLPAEESGDLNLTFQLNTAGSDQFQLGNLSLQALPQLPSVSIGPSSADSQPH